MMCDNDKQEVARAAADRTAAHIERGGRGGDQHSPLLAWLLAGLAVF